MKYLELGKQARIIKVYGYNTENGEVLVMTVNHISLTALRQRLTENRDGVVTRCTCLIEKVGALRQLRAQRVEQHVWLPALPVKPLRQRLETAEHAPPRHINTNINTINTTSTTPRPEHILTH